MSVLEERFNKLSAAAKKCMILTAAISSIGMIILAIAGWFILNHLIADLPAWVGIICLAWVFLWLLNLVIAPLIRYRRYRYLIDEEKVVVKEGLLFVRQDFAPIERIHQVTVKSGPIDRMFSLANVIVTTAGGTVSVRLLQANIAEEIAETLQAKVRYLLAQQGISLAQMPKDDRTKPQQEQGEI